MAPEVAQAVLATVVQAAVMQCRMLPFSVGEIQAAAQVIYDLVHGGAMEQQSE